MAKDIIQLLSRGTLYFTNGLNFYIVNRFVWVWIIKNVTNNEKIWTITEKLNSYGEFIVVYENRILKWTLSEKS